MNETAEKRRENRSRRAEGYAWICLVCIVLSMFYLNIHTPLAMDDYDYSFSWATGKPLSGFADILRSQQVHYRIWGGRSIVHAFAQFFLWAGKPLFNVCNALMYGMLIYATAVLLQKKQGLGMLQVLLCHAWLLLIPYFGTVFLWLDGSCNYLWGTVCALAPLVLAYETRKGRSIPLWQAVPCCFIAGWTNENTACGIFGALAVFFFLKHLKREKSIPFCWLAAHLAGILVMLLAPGNYSRASGKTALSVAVLADRTVHAAYYYLRYAGIPLLISVIGAWKSREREIGIEMVENHLCLLASMLSAAAMVASPEMSDRAFTGAVILALADALQYCPRLKETAGKKVHFLAAALLLGIFVMSLQAVRDVNAHEAYWKNQLIEIGRAREEKEREVHLSQETLRSRYILPVQLAETPEAWPNSTLSKWFGIDIYSENGGTLSEP